MSKISLVVGGSSGIGLVLVNKLLSEGHRVINLDIKELIIKSPNYQFQKIDLSNDQTFLGAFTNILDQNIRHNIDNYFHCAGIAEPPTEDLKSDYNFIDKLININASSLIKLTSLVKNGLIKDGGSIVVVSSAHSLRAANWNPIYSATKGFIDSFVRSYAKTLIEDAKRNGTELIRINAVNPEMIDTPLIHDLFVGREDDLKKVVDGRIMKRLLTPEEIVDTMLFLSSDSASGITGELIKIGGPT
jgi:NAD(P)-dependent dehydrogenase (short-subunit alcohol dehydrogenase family)